MQLLIIDDSFSDYELARMALKTIPGIEFTHADDFETFKENFSPGKYAAIISDYNLSGILGTDILKYVKELEPEIPFIIVSGALGEERAVEVIRQGATDYVLKDRFDKLPITLLRALKESDAIKSKEQGLQKIKESEEKFRKIFESIGDVYYQADMNGLVTMMSPSCFHITGYSPEEVIGKPVSMFYEKPETRVKLIERLMRDKKINNYEVNLVSKNKNIHCVSANISLTFDDNGSPTGLQGLFRDITDLKKQGDEIIKQSQKLQESHKLNTQIIETSEQFFYVSSVDQKNSSNNNLTYVSKQVEEIFGLNEKELISNTMLWYEGIHKDELGFIKEDTKNLYTLKVPVTVTYRFKNYKTNEYIWVEDYVCPLVDENGNVTELFGSVKDITSRKKNEEELIKRERQLSEAQLIAKLGSWEFNPATKKVNWTEQISQILEIKTENNTTGFDEFCSYFHPEDALMVKANINRALLSESRVPLNFRIITKSGAEKFISGKAVKILNSENAYIVTGTLQDITELKSLEKEKNEIQQKTLLMLEDLVRQRTMEVVKQREIIEEKNKDITDSIQYAKRLQNGILPSTSMINFNIPENFILYYPKDIVAGDFYWAHKKDDAFIIAVADCTGHGVPGAIVSMVCSNALERAVNEFGITDPGKLLDKVTELVIFAFERSGDELKDGMDISLLLIDKFNKIVKWAGANNALFYWQNNELNKITANKQPVGKFIKQEPFTTHTMPYVANTTYYLISDGYADQFGGEKGKKFKQNQLTQLFSTFNSAPLSDQKEILQKAFMDWKGTNEQVDDVTLIGLKLD